jgi:hypothetical protein
MTNPSKLADILTDVWNNGSLNGNTAKFMGTEEAEAAILAWIDQAIGPNNYDDLTPPAIAKNVYRDQLRHSLGIDTEKEA